MKQVIVTWYNYEDTICKVLRAEPRPIEIIGFLIEKDERCVILGNDLDNRYCTNRRTAIPRSYIVDIVELGIINK